MPPPRSFTEQLRADPPKGTPALEECFIMRMPPEVAAHVRSLLKDSQLQNRLMIQMNPHKRRADVTLKRDPNNKNELEDIELRGKILDLPTINEIYKSLDNKNMYKCCDLHQMLILQYKDEFEEHDAEFGDDEEEDDFDPNDPKQVAMRDKMYQYPHGLSPPFKNIRRHRFRKTAKKKYINATEVENEVKKLLRAEQENCEECDYNITYKDVDIRDIKDKNKKKLLSNVSIGWSKGRSRGLTSSPSVHNTSASVNPSSSLYSINESKTEFLPNEEDLFGTVTSSSDDSTQ